MSLRSDVTFVTTLIVGAIRQILGETFRTLADYLLRDKVPPPPETIKVEPTPVHPRQKATPQRVVINCAPPPEVLVKASKPRDRSKYNPKEHGQYKIAAIGILKTLLENGSRLSAPALAKIHTNSTDSTIRTACKTMVKDGILTTEYDENSKSDVYWVVDLNAARVHLAELEASAPVLPPSDESREPQASLD